MIVSFPFYSILLSKLAEIYAWNDLKFFKLAAVSKKIFSVMKSNEKRLHDSQCSGLDNVDINNFLGRIFQRK